MSRRRRLLTRLLPAVVAGVVALGALVGVLLPAAGRSAPDSAPPQPVLGAVDGDTVLFGSATEGDAAGQSWGYRLLPLDVPPPEVDGVRLAFGPITGGSATPQLAFVRGTAAGEWQVASTPLDVHGDPYRGPAPNPRLARLTPRGGGVLVGQDSNRPAADQLVVLRAQPGKGYQEIAKPPSTVLLGADDPNPGDEAEALAGDRGAGRVSVAAADRNGKTELFFAPVGRDVEVAVVVQDGGDDDSAWSREPVDVTGATEFRTAAVAAATPDNAWLVGHSSGEGVRLFGRDTSGATPEWKELDLGSSPFAGGAAATTAGISDVTPLGGNAQTLTVTADGMWVDGHLQADGNAYTFTLFVRPGAPVGSRVTSFCDAPVAGGGALCDHPLGADLSETDGYRSFAWADPDAPTGTGTRIVTNPLRRGGEGQSNRGTYLRFAGDDVRRMPGGGGNFLPGGAFTSASEGWIQGPVQVGGDVASPKLKEWPIALRAPLNAATPAPGAAVGDLGSGALAVGADGAIARYAPGQGWSREFLLSAAGSVARPNLRGVAWPEPDRAHAVGDLGAMWMWRADTGLWEKDPAAPIGFEANLMGVAFDPSDPQRGFAVGKGGTILHYDKTWIADALPDGFTAANVTAVAFAGHQALAVTPAGVLVNDGGAWHVDTGVSDLLATLPEKDLDLYTVAGLPDGGAVVAGRNIVLERDTPTGPWRFSRQPLLGATAVAVGAFREDGAVRALVSVAPRLAFPVPDPPIDVDPNAPPPLIAPFGLAGDGYVVRETATGWRDEQRSSFLGSGLDRPVKSDPVAAFVLDSSGAGWAVGGWSGAADNAGRGSSARGGSARDTRSRVQTAAIARYAPGGDPAGSGGGAQVQTDAPVALNAGVVRFAVGGNAQCEAACADLSAQGIAPDRMLGGALDQAGALATRASGPRAFLYTGGRNKPGSDVAGDSTEEQRFAALLGDRPSLPVYGAVHAGDVDGGGSASAFTDAFAAADVPFGAAGSSHPANVATDGIPGIQPSSGARTHYAFDSSGADGTVRVIVIDNSAGSLADSDPHQNPAEPQLGWLRDVLQDAKARGIPAIVVGSRDLNPNAQPALNVASDGDTVAQLLVDEGASAYFFDRPEENRQGTIPAGADTTIPEFGTGTLGYRSAITNAASVGKPDALFGDGGFLLAEIDAAKRDPATNRAPVAVRLIPVLDQLSIQAVDGTLLRRSRPALFQGLGRRPVAGDRWGSSGGDGVPDPAGASPYGVFPPDRCDLSGCSTRISPEYSFTSKDPDILDFVEQDPNSANLHKPLLDAESKVVTDGASGLVCPFNAGKTVVTVAAGGRAISLPVQVLGGTVARPCGTRLLEPGNRPPTKPSVDVPPSTPPSNTPSSAPPPVLAPPPAPIVAAVAAPLVVKKLVTPAKPRPPVARPFTPLAPFVPTVLPQGGSKLHGGSPPAPVPPPAPFFAQPIPPGGATVRVQEEKREEEIAPESSSAAHRYNADDSLSYAPYVGAALLLAFLAGVTIRPGRRRDPAYALNRVIYTQRPRRRP